jgi:ankyrin repeat protein
MDNREIVSALLKAGCDVDIRNKSDHTGNVRMRPLLHNAAFWGRAELAVLLIESGADVNALDEHQGTPLDEARRLKNKMVEDLLLKHGAKSGPGD